MKAATRIFLAAACAAMALPLPAREKNCRIAYCNLCKAYSVCFTGGPAPHKAFNTKKDAEDWITANCSGGGREPSGGLYIENQDPLEPKPSA